MADFVLGVDGGNTKTIALVARSDGVIVGAGRSGCGDIYRYGDAAAVAEITQAASTALKAAGIQAGDLAAGTFSLAGADWLEDFETIHAAMMQHQLGKSIIVVNDAVGALRAGSPDGTGVAVVCGTGAGTASRNANGQVWHSSH